MGWNWPLRRRTYLCTVPVLNFPAILFKISLILAPHLVQDLVEVARWGSIHLHIDAVTELGAKGTGLLQEGTKRGEYLEPFVIICITLIQRDC